MLDDFLTRAILAGIGVALAAGPLGCFVLWRRMAYFGDTLAHSALLGVALGLAFQIAPTIAVTLLCATMAVIIVVAEQSGRVAIDTVLGIIAHSALALGLVAIGLMEHVRVDLLGYLFGDILAVSRVDVIGIFAASAGVLACLAAIWRDLLALTVHAELAEAEGARRLRTRLAFMLLLAITIAAAMPVVGLLLTTALLIVPPAAARAVARSPEEMALGAAVAGALSVLGGIGGSLIWDTPSGPSIVVAAMMLFIAGQLWRSVAALRGT